VQIPLIKGIATAELWICPIATGSPSNRKGLNGLKIPFRARIQVAMYLARRHTKASLHEIGENFGGRHHGTVLHACKAVSARMKNEDQFRQTIAGLDTKLDR
jgi:hypothetical protein